MTAPENTSSSAKDNRLQTAALLLIGGFVIHNADHARRGLDSVTESLVWAGTLLMVLATVVVTLILTRHALAAAAAAVMGFTIAFGVSASHLLPNWGPISDSLPQGDVDAFTWIAVSSEIAAGLWLGWVGLSVLRENDFRIGPRLAT